MIVKNVNLEAVCGITSKIKDSTLPEIALAGRSNVGKSSLINALINRKSYAKTSSTPGKTQTLNFYNVNDMMYLVDLPGYGYTRISRSQSDKWAKMINRYLNASEALRAIMQLVDLRHEPSSLDKQMFEWIRQSNIPYIIIATKLDKIPKSKVALHKNIIRSAFKIDENIPIYAFSALSKSGREEIWNSIDKILEI